MTVPKIDLLHLGLNFFYFNAQTIE